MSPAAERIFSFGQKWSYCHLNLADVTLVSTRSSQLKANDPRSVCLPSLLPWQNTKQQQHKTHFKTGAMRKEAESVYNAHTNTHTRHVNPQTDSSALSPNLVCCCACMFLHTHTHTLLWQHIKQYGIGLPLARQPAAASTLRPRYHF